MFHRLRQPEGCHTRRDLRIIIPRNSKGAATK